MSKKKVKVADLYLDKDIIDTLVKEQKQNLIAKTAAAKAAERTRYINALLKTKEYKDLRKLLRDRHKSLDHYKDITSTITVRYSPTIFTGFTNSDTVQIDWVTIKSPFEKEEARWVKELQVIYKKINSDLDKFFKKHSITQSEKHTLGLYKIKCQ